MAAFNNPFWRLAALPPACTPTGRCQHPPPPLQAAHDRRAPPPDCSPQCRRAQSLPLRRLCLRRLLAPAAPPLMSGSVSMPWRRQLGGGEAQLLLWAAVVVGSAHVRGQEGVRRGRLEGGSTCLGPWAAQGPPQCAGSCSITVLFRVRTPCNSGAVAGQGKSCRAHRRMQEARPETCGGRLPPCS